MSMQPTLMSSPFIDDLALCVNPAFDPPLLADPRAGELPPVGRRRHRRPEQLRYQLGVQALPES